jgi:hypothetical protein
MRIVYRIDDYEKYEFEPSQDDLREFAIDDFVNNQGFDRKTAEKIYDSIIYNYGLDEKFFEDAKESGELKDYFEEMAMEEYREMR